MASSDQELEQGTEWILSYRDDLGFRITPASI
jgi:hypothetical protein